LCGGCHVKATGQLGVFKIISEASIASGVRRIEAKCGINAFIYISEHFKKTKKIATLIGANLNEIDSTVEELYNSNKRLFVENKKLKEKLILSELDVNLNKYAKR